jgi:NADH-quinone oxidoreductase subunit C
MINVEDIVKNIETFINSSGFKFEKLNIDNFIAYSLEHKDLIPTLEFLKSSEDLRFTILTDLFAADFPSKEKRFEIVYSLLSLKLNMRILIKTYADDEELVPSAAVLFNAACWYEREIFDMFGVRFKDCPDMRRILTDYGFIGHPLRKDFPVTGHLEVKYDEQLEQVIYRPVQLDQEFRMFDFLSPWQGPKYTLPGDEKATK